MNIQIKATALLLPLALTSCLNTSSELHEDGSPLDDARWSVEFVAQDSEFDEVVIDDPDFGSETFKNQDRSRQELRASYGTEAVRGTFGLIAEDFIDDEGGGGFALGIEGEPRFYTLDWGPSGVDVFVKYRLGATIGGGDKATIAGAEVDFAYLDIESQLGIGLDLGGGLQPSIGVVNHSLTGSVEFPTETDDDWEGDDLDADATGAFIALDYIPEDQDWNLGLQAVFGDYQSIGLTIGWSF